MSDEALLSKSVRLTWLLCWPMEPVWELGTLWRGLWGAGHSVCVDTALGRACILRGMDDGELPATQSHLLVGRVSDRVLP